MTDISPPQPSDETQISMNDDDNNSDEIIPSQQSSSVQSLSINDRKRLSAGQLIVDCAAVVNQT